MQSVPLVEVKKKLSTQMERINFAREQGYYMPKMPGYDSKFFCQWLAGQKKVIIIFNFINLVIGFRFNRGF